MGIVIEGAIKSYGKVQVLHDIHLHIPTGDFMALLGPSGSGKTTLLRVIAGLENLDQGKIYFNNVDFTTKKVQERHVGFVFQHYALFKHMTVFDNIAFGLKVRPRKMRPAKKEIRDKVMSLLQLIQLEHVADRYPSQLSGGQRQRVALARALAVEPDVLLLDEPFGALDAKVRQEMRHWLKSLHQKFHITTIFVTHDQEEAFEMADTVVIMNQGRIEQIGAPQEVYEKPTNAFVYSFLGRVNEIRGEISTDPHTLNELGEKIGYIRPHEITLSRSPSLTSEPAEVCHVHCIGSIARILLKRLCNEQLFEAEVSLTRYHELAPLHQGEILFADLSNTVVFETPTSAEVVSVQV